MANLNGLKAALGKSAGEIYDAAGVATIRQAIAILGASHPLVQTHTRIIKSIDNYMAANPPIRAMSRGYRGMGVS